MEKWDSPGTIYCTGGVANTILQKKDEDETDATAELHTTLAHFGLTQQRASADSSTFQVDFSELGFDAIA